ncbi:HNH endonuclease [Arthrobacter sp. NPDC058192]|uniref:HNH endonuclease n=1 Tax=Arthrobacter sp. NPDC058192 TaxID=3346372 RepID=UPI0036EC7688
MKRSWADLEPQSIDRAIRLWHELGSEEFIARTRFKESHRYVVIDRGQQIASKPLVAMAFQLQFGCGEDGPPRLSGGEQTRAILDRLGYKLTDLHDEGLQEAAQRPKIAVGPSTKFWWVNQSVNFEPVYDDGTLWAPLKNRRGHQVDHWLTLDTVVPGDLVIHYASPEIRGLSRVATMPQPAFPPRGYDDVPADTKGTLVLTEPVKEIRVPRDQALGVLDRGPGPVTTGGTLRNGYFFSLAADRALEILRRAGIETSGTAVDESRENDEPLESYLGGPTDKLAAVAIRAEQRFLRDQLLRRWGSSCALCGRSLPKELVVAAHIKPRWACSENERMDTRNVSMLACLFGCDALFELGYVVIGEHGIIKRGSRGSAKVEDRLVDIVGRRCPAHGDESRQYFAWHRQHHSSRLSGLR